MTTHDERLTLLEQRVDSLQRENITQKTDSTRIITILNRIVTTQEINYRELTENQTMLAGIANGQGLNIKRISQDIQNMNAQITNLTEGVKDIKLDLKDMKHDITEMRHDINEMNDTINETRNMITKILERLPKN